MVRINVDGLPFIREMTTPRKLLAGSQLEWLYCPYGGFPIDKITWDKDGKHKEVGTYSAVALHPSFLKDYFYISVNVVNLSFLLLGFGFLA